MPIEKMGQPIKILQIEDNPDDQLLTNRMLEKAKYTPFEINFADTLSTGIQYTTEWPVDIILLDLNLPDSLGVDTYLKLKLQVPEIPVVVLSGSEDEEMSLKAVHAGAQDYLIKGQIDSNLLVRSLRYAIERKSAEDIIKNLAYHDSLTGLPSRTLFNDRFTMAIADSKRNDRKTAFIMLDLDQFKEINDNFGHDIGDEVLKEVSTKLTGILRQTDTVCRMGGDEFILLIPEIKAKEMVDEVAKRIVAAMGTPFTLHGVLERITASFGIAIYPDDGVSLETLTKHADMAMYEVKKTGRDNYLYYQPYMKGEGLKA
jgi:diguanylate cyclase (GGDEF)-like protein